MDGPGFRTSIYFAGCRHECEGCHNPQSWDFNAGKEMTFEEILAVVREEDFNVTFTGGDPLYHPAEIKELSRMIKEAGHIVWLYTGFTAEEIAGDPTLLDALMYVDTIVEGRFVLALRDTDLQFRGSSNQRILKLDHTSCDLGLNAYSLNI